MSAIEKAVEVGLEEAERQEFLKAVAPVPTKPVKGGKGKGGSKKVKAAPVAETVVAAPEAAASEVDDLATRNHNVVMAAFAKANISADSVKSADAPTDPKWDALDALDLEGLLLGDIKGEFDRMTTIRSEAFDLMRKLGGMDLPGLKKSTEKRAFQFKTRIPIEAMTQAREDLKRRANGDWDRLKNLERTFDALRTEWFKWDNDPTLDVNAKATMQKLIDAWIAAYPNGKMQADHEAMLAEAEKLELELLEAQIKHEELFEKASAMFAEANEIAVKHGWSVTSKKDKDTKGGDASRK